MQIAILLSTYNGATYLLEQLDSYEKQLHADWTLWASDDGSSDDTVAIINRFAKKIGGNKVHQLKGPKQGFAANFLSLVHNPSIKADGYAYSDQDDIWIASKLERAAQFLTSVPDNIPALYCSRTTYVNKINHPIGISHKFYKPTVFSNALVQNVASGNTMVFNQAARNLLLQIEESAVIGLHDWLTYILVTGAGGLVYLDKKPSVRYRQHSKNIIGMNTGIKAAIYRAYLLFYKDRFRLWNEQHIQILNKMQSSLAPSNRFIYEKFIDARELKGFVKVFAFKRIGLYRQTFLGNITFYLAALFNKV